MIGSGLYEVEVEGKTVGFQFGMLASMYTEEKSGQSIYDVFKEIAQARIKGILYYFMGGAMAYNEYHGIKEPVTLAGIASIIESIGTEKALEIYSKSIGSPLIKNGQAPKETGQVEA